jgi:anaerobic selenocysteine-containing dehydrogenase
LFYLARHQNITRFRKIHPKVEAEMHPEDAAELGIQEGDPIRIISETGVAVAYARIVHRAELFKGVVEVYHGWAEWRINFVTLDHVTDPISGFPLLKAVPVRIEKWTGD